LLLVCFFLFVSVLFVDCCKGCSRAIYEENNVISFPL
jgi:hypothetical protein